jgi:glycerophosphoryl diester phosphodiesterase
LRTSLAITAAVAASTLLLPTSGSAQVPDLSNKWMDRRILNIAHQGGEEEAPSDTLYAFKTALEKGADVLEMDVHATLDREIVVLHDATVDRTTNGAGRVDELTLAQIKELDAAHWFVPDCGTCHNRPDEDYELRGYATEERELPEELELAGFEPNDFTIPTLREVLTAFPDTWINIEIKATFPDTEPYEEELADLLAEFDRTDDTIVVSFLDHATERFKFYAPDVDTAAGTGQVGAFWASSQGPLPGAPNPRYKALQVPITFEGQEVVTEDFVTDAHANNLAVHVWTINDRETMEWLIDIGVDGIMTDRPTLLEELLHPSITAVPGPILLGAR